MKKVYFMPGMAASPSIFENIVLPKEYKKVLLNWIAPLDNEGLSDYVYRLSEFVDKQEKPILVGVSFGGVIVQELAKIIDYDRIILISTIKKDKELPMVMKFSRCTGVHKVLPTRVLENQRMWDFMSFFRELKKTKKLYDRYGFLSSPDYLKWAINAIVNWRQEHELPRTIHIQGTKDEVFPIKNIENVIRVENGTHIMIVDRYKWFNENLPEILRRDI